MLVLAPTRELALQSAEVIAEAGGHCGIKSVCVYGGVPKRDQKIALGGGRGGGCVQVVVATPGRLKDLVGEGACDLSKVCPEIGGCYFSMVLVSYVPLELLAFAVWTLSTNGAVRFFFCGGSDGGSDGVVAIFDTLNAYCCRCGDVPRAFVPGAETGTVLHLGKTRSCDRQRWCCVAEVRETVEGGIFGGGANPSARLNILLEYSDQG